MGPLEEQLEDEWYMVRHSGEIPEIALNASFYYLCQDKRGPQLTLTKEQRLQLKYAARDRFREIVLRDLIPENRDKTIYRGTERAIANWQRYVDFCGRQDLRVGEFRDQVAEQFRTFMAAEQQAATGCDCPSGINCSLDDLIQFAHSLGINDSDFHTLLTMSCQK